MYPCVQISNIKHVTCYRMYLSWKLFTTVCVKLKNFTNTAMCEGWAVTVILPLNKHDHNAQPYGQRGYAAIM